MDGRQKSNAPTGNRTQGKCLEGIYVTTTPSAPCVTFTVTPQDLGRMNVSGRESILPDINCASEVNSATHLALVPTDLRTINSVRERGMLRSNHRMQLQIRVITRHSTIDSQKDFSQNSRVIHLLCYDSSEPFQSLCHFTQ
eukprot:scaffold13744_cov88-Skeletonema_dohrnii-CCMP3373.AAC.2